MQIKNFLLLACFFATTFLGATDATSFLNPNPINMVGDSCDLAAPTNFRAIGNGATWVSLGWIGDPNAKAHKVRAYRASDGVLVRTKTFLLNTPNGLHIVDSLAPGILYHFVINPICQGGGVSNRSANTDSGTLIADLIVTGYTAPNLGTYCPLVAPGGVCAFSNVGNIPTGFRVKNTITQAQRTFTIIPLVLGNITIFQVHLENDNSRELFKIRCRTANPTFEPTCTSEFIEIWEPSQFGGETLIAFFHLENSATTGTFVCTILSPNRSIVRMNDGSSLPGGPGPGGPGGGGGGGRPAGGRSDISPSSNQFATVAPNPFSESLDVFPDQPSAQSIHLQMYNLSGQKVLDQQLPGGQDQYTLSTENLSNGFYLLRIEADGNVQTLKVVKSE